MYVYIAYLIILLFLFSCGTNKAENQSVENSASGSNLEATVDAKAQEGPFYETIPNGNRLTQESLASYVPETIAGMKISGKPIFTTSEPDPQNGGVKYSMSAYYMGSENNASISLTVEDFADDQEIINRIKENGLVLTNNDFTTMRQNEKGWYISENNLGRSRSITVRNPRFIIEINVKQRELPSFAEIMDMFENSHLPKLLDLEIPSGEVSKKEIASNKLSISCDQLLPASQVASLCNISAVKVMATEFEGENNCNRYYKIPPGNAGSLVFILTQYGDDQMALQAVEYKINDSNLKSYEVSGVGDQAVMVTVGSDLYFSVAHKNVLIELRSFMDSLTDGPDMCRDEKGLKALAQEIIENYTKIAN